MLYAVCCPGTLDSSLRCAPFGMTSDAVMHDVITTENSYQT